MKYDMDEALSEVLRRKEIEFRKQRRQSLRKLSGTSAALFVALAATVYKLAAPLPGEAGESVYGAFRLSQSAGGYVLVGVICFALAVAVTLLCLKWRDRPGGNSPEDEERGP